MRWVWGIVLWLLATGVVHARTEHVRGDYRFETGPVPDYVVRRDVAQAWDPAAPGADGGTWRFWLFDRQADRRDGADRTFVDYAYEARNASLLGDAGRFTIEFNPVYQRLVIHEVALRRDGAWQDRLVPDRISLARRESGFERDLADGQVAALVVLDDVRVDDVVRLVYSIDGSNPILAGDVYDSVALAWGSPMLDVSLRVLHPPGSDPLVVKHRSDAVPRVEATADATVVSVQAHGAPAVVDEGDYPAWFKRHPRISVAARRDWAGVVGWALPLYPAVSALPADLEARIATWRRLREPADRMRAALRAVQDEVRYFGVEMGDNTHRPAAPGDTWTRRYGDCKDKSYLLSTILARMDIAAVPALVSNGSGRAIADGPPSASAFDHVIVRARLGDRTVWVDPTATLEGGDPRDSDQRRYGLALPVEAGATALVTVDAPRDAGNGVHLVEKLVSEADGRAMRMSVATTYRGAAADHIRRHFAGERVEDRSRRYADHYRKRLGELSVESAPAVADDRERNVLVVSEAYRLQSPLDDESASVRALDLFADAIDRPTLLPRTLSREGPLQTYASGDYVHESQVETPQSWRPRFRDERDSAKGPGIDYERSVRRTDAGVAITHRVAVTREDLAAVDMPEHVAQLRKLREGIASRLRYDVPATIDDASRQQRLEALLQGVLDEGRKP